MTAWVAGAAFVVGYYARVIWDEIEWWRVRSAHQRAIGEQEWRDVGDEWRRYLP